MYLTALHSHKNVNIIQFLTVKLQTFMGKEWNKSSPRGTFTLTVRPSCLLFLIAGISFP